MLFEVGGGVPLSFQLRQFPLGLLQLPFALFVHGKEVPVRELPHGVEGEQLLFLFLHDLHGVPQLCHTFGEVLLLIQ